MNILGISAFYHDSAACLLRDGEIVAALQEERFTRRKHDFRFPRRAIERCLKEGGIESNDLDLVAFYDKPLTKFNRLLETYLTFAPRGLRSFTKAMPLWLGEKLWIPDVIRKELDYEGSIIYPEHHESHAASAFFLSPFERAAILTLDGVGEWATASCGVGEGNRVRIEAEQQFPHSLGLLYSAFTYFTGFRVNSGEYKLMGLAPFGRPLYVEQILDHLVDLKEDGSFHLNMDYFDYCAGLRMTNERFARLFRGPPRRPEGQITQREMDLASSIQKVTEEIMLRTAKYVRRVTGERFLCLAGGVALNCVANARILQSKIFEDLWIQPAAGDAGGALGAALIGYHHYRDCPAAPKDGFDRQRFSYLGTSYTDEEIAAFLKGMEANRPQYCPTPEVLCEVVSNLLAEGKVVGWFQGRMEFGPRALGSRSILADPRRPEMQKKLNLKIKYREGFRPFAPAVLKEEASDWFAFDHASPYMLLVAPVHPQKWTSITETDRERRGLDMLEVVRTEIPAVTHVDGSARLQTVERDGNPLFYDLMRQFQRETGCPVLINTSFNIRGEPIVESPADAYRCYMRTGMDAVALGSYVLVKGERHKTRAPQPSDQARMNWAREIPETVGRIDRSPSTLRRFGLAVGGVFMVISLALNLGSAPFTLMLGLFAAGAVLALVGVVAPLRLNLVYRAWMAFALLLGGAVSRIILHGIFGLVVVPLGLAAKVVGKRFMNLSYRADVESYWIPRNKDEGVDYEKLY